MDRHDEELLDKQVRRIAPPPPNNGLTLLAIVAVFLAGLTFGGFLFMPKRESIRTASNNATSTLSFFLNGGPNITR
jgi:NhaP-type Na+/H+ or K+/H+ antiporter